MKAVIRFALAGLAGAALLAPARAHGQTVLFDGYTNGCFQNPGPYCNPTANSSFQYDTKGPLRWENSRFTGNTSNGFLAIGAGVNARGVQDSNNLGAFYLGWAPGFSFANHTFSLLVSFIAPTAPSQTGRAILRGTVSDWNVGGVFVNFDNSPHLFSDGVYNYSLVVNDVSLTSPSQGYNQGCPDGLEGIRCAPLTGYVTATQIVPEPMSMLLLGTGLAGLGAARRRRSRLA